MYFPSNPEAKYLWVGAPGIIQGSNVPAREDWLRE